MLEAWLSVFLVPGGAVATLTAAWVAGAATAVASVPRAPARQRHVAIVAPAGAAHGAEALRRPQ